MIVILMQIGNTKRLPSQSLYSIRLPSQSLRTMRLPSQSLLYFICVRRRVYYSFKFQQSKSLVKEV